MSSIQDNSRLYSFLKPFVCSVIRRSYSRFEVVGLENIPDNAAVIIAPNHSNTLMDPLVILASRKGPTSLGARADIFRKHEKILTWLKMVPLPRMRDGLREVEKNRETNAKVLEAMSCGLPFCMFAEGRHRTMHSLLPINKGITRIAFEAAETVDMPVYIVPAGIDYSDYFRFRSRVKLTYGEPVDIKAYMAENADLEKGELQMKLRRLLYERISELFFFLPDDENYERRLAEEMAKLPRKSRSSLFWRVPLAILLLPVFLLASIISLPTLIPALILSRKVKDPAFRNSMRFAACLATAPLLITAPAYRLVWDMHEKARNLFEDLRSLA